MVKNAGRLNNKSQTSSYQISININKEQAKEPGYKLPIGISVFGWHSGHLYKPKAVTAL